MTRERALVAADQIAERDEDVEVMDLVCRRQVLNKQIADVPQHQHEDTSEALLQHAPVVMEGRISCMGLTCVRTRQVAELVEGARGSP
jgi:hypothetical protein